MTKLRPASHPPFVPVGPEILTGAIYDGIREMDVMFVNRVLELVENGMTSQWAIDTARRESYHPRLNKLSAFARALAESRMPPKERAP